jgi:hypothetical protein
MNDGDGGAQYYTERYTYKQHKMYTTVSEHRFK